MIVNCLATASQKSFRMRWSPYILILLAQASIFTIDKIAIVQIEKKILLESAVITFLWLYMSEFKK